VRELAGLSAQQSYKARGCHGKLMRNCNRRRVEVAVGDHISGWCCGLVGGEQRLSTVFSCGAQGN
jgi:hypothetical protein